VKVKVTLDLKNHWTKWKRTKAMPRLLMEKQKANIKKLLRLKELNARTLISFFHIQILSEYFASGYLKKNISNLKVLFSPLLLLIV